MTQQKTQRNTENEWKNTPSDKYDEEQDGADTDMLQKKAKKLLDTGALASGANGVEVIMQRMRHQKSTA